MWKCGNVRRCSFLFSTRAGVCGLRRLLEQFVTSPSSCSILSWQEGVDGGHRTRCGYSTLFEPEPYLQLYPSTITCRLHESIFPLRNHNSPLPSPPLFPLTKQPPTPGLAKTNKCHPRSLHHNHPPTQPQPSPAQPITPPATIPPNFIPIATTSTSNLLHLRRKPREEESSERNVW